MESVPFSLSYAAMMASERLRGAQCQQSMKALPTANVRNGRIAITGSLSRDDSKKGTSCRDFPAGVLTTSLLSC